MKVNFRQALITVMLALLLFFTINASLQASIVEDVSMLPTLVAGQRIIIVKIFYYFSEPKRGDIIIVHPPIDQEREFVKRLVGLPGDTIEVKDHLVYVNNISLNEPYLKDRPAYSYGPFTVPDNNYFLLGDNRNNSADSHLNWTVTRDEIVGKAWLRIWPPDKWGSPGSYPLDDELAGRFASEVQPSN
jgi:signal peptidase I